MRSAVDYHTKSANLEVYYRQSCPRAVCLAGLRLGADPCHSETLGMSLLYVSIHTGFVCHIQLSL